MSSSYIDDGMNNKASIINKQRHIISTYNKPMSYTPKSSFTINHTKTQSNQSFFKKSSTQQSKNNLHKSQNI